MSLINASLLFGMGLAALPVILHLVMRAKPKRIEFPALRLLKTRKVSNARRMQLRHLLLLLLRSLLIAVLVLAIARPSLPAARYGLRWWEWLSLATVAALSAATYFWLTRQSSTPSIAAFDRKERRGRVRLWCVVLGTLAAMLAVGLPWGLRLQAELSSPRNEATENVPVAAVFLIDTSLSMNYRYENKTRLEQARTVIREHLGRFPAGSRAAIAGLSADDDIVFQADLTGAASRLDTLTATTVPEPINRRLKAAIQFQIDDRTADQERRGMVGGDDTHAREIYVLTDFSKTAWRDPDESGLSDALKAADWLQVYLVDVSVPLPTNSAISNLTLSEETSVAGRDLLLTMTVSATTGAPMTTTLETLLVENGVETRAGAPQIVKLENGAAQIQTTLRVTGTQPFVEGLVRLTSEDPLPDDNYRYFTCGVRPKPNVLLIADTNDESWYLRNALQPIVFEKQGIRVCEITRVSTAQASQQSFANFDVVMLINCQRPDQRLWESLKNFASGGGGVLVVAGSDKIQLGAWMVEPAKELLPGTPLRFVNFNTEPGHLKLIT
ncbi:MAG TPA: BatA and WFA domain-containing protein, partial [Planctomycetaceae bacterium]|nr:BatA and WFA domain-containing protein [Planctomycetaceae bacterium]